MSYIDALLYASNNSLQRNDAIYVLENYFKLIDLSNNEKILDVGTGDGAVLSDLILPKMPSDLKEIVALDISEEMLNLAKKRFLCHSNMEFVCLPIETPVIPLKFHKIFNHIFSFYCLHFVINPRQAYENLFIMLKAGGDMLLTIVANHPVFDVYEAMVKMEMWAPFMTDIVQFITPYQHCNSGAEEIEDILQSVGFVNYRCDLVERVYTHENIAEFWKWASGVNPFIKRIPDRYLRLYQEDYLTVIKTLPNVTFEDIKAEKGRISVSYRMLVVYASAPITIVKK